MCAYRPPLHLSALSRNRLSTHLHPAVCSAAVTEARAGDDAAKARIRVLRVIARLNVGGPALHAVLLTERLDPARYESRLVAG